MVGRFTWHVFVISKFVCFLHDVRMMYGTAHLEQETLSQMSNLFIRFSMIDLLNTMELLPRSS